MEEGQLMLASLLRREVRDAKDREVGHLEDLARACEERGRWEFLITIGTLRLERATGSPCNPIAVF